MKRKLWISLFFEYISVLLILLLTALIGNHTVNVSVESAPIENRPCIIVDAGHGGVDGGATSCTGVLESSINLEIALRLNDLLHFLGIDTVMIRTTDRSVYTEGASIAAKKLSDLKQRVKTVNEQNDAVLVSIHQNYFPDSRYHGAQVFYNNIHDSSALGKHMQSAFIATINKGSNRRAKKATGLYLMENIDCVGVLVECGFISNATEEALLRSKPYQQKVCCVIAASCNSYLNDRIA